jgi:hypothetical protein
MKVEIIKKNMEGFSGDAWLVKKGTDFFIVSGTHTLFTGWEVLVFKSDKNGKIKDWSDVTGGRGISHEKAIEMLEEMRP